MKSCRNLLTLLVFFGGIIFLSNSTANANLVVLGTIEYANQQRQLIYDTNKDITWLDYSQDLDTWYNQVNWAANLSFTVNGVIYDSWRLPSTVDGEWEWGDDGSTTAGFNITSSEMGHLYYTELSNSAHPVSTEDGSNPDPTAVLENASPFQNLISGAFWSETTWMYGDEPSAWVFMTASGYQTADHKDGSQSGGYEGGGHNAIAVMDGKVEFNSTAVPLPTSVILFGVGLVGLATASRRRENRGRTTIR